MSIDKMDSSAVYTLFEEVKQLIKKPDSKEQNNINPIDLSGVENKVNQSEERILLKLDKLTQNTAHPVLQKHQHRISIDIASSWVFIALVSLSLLLLCAIGLNISQRSKNSALKDNDLKYRYIKMYKGVSSSDLIWLENVFYYPDSAYIVKNIKKEISDYEHRLEQQIRKQEQVRLNNEKNKKLGKEIEDLKGRK